MNPITLYGHPESGHSYKVKLMLDVAKVNYTYRQVDILVERDARPEPFRSLSLARFGEVPLVSIGQTHYVQSNAILIELADTLGLFGGSGRKGTLSCKEWLMWEANKLGLSLPHLRLARNYFPDDYPPGAVQWLASRFKEDIGRLDKELRDGRRFILDDELSIADFSLAGYLFWSNQAQVDLPGTVIDWLGRIASLEGWQSPYACLSQHPGYETFGLVKEEFDPRLAVV
ncbi:MULTISPECIES: glutathione S-transferase family protein [unclassified Pseudomonas]|uniref:glutathione S-transferase family protein n=1 Tax=unclassified Pseudomonas TaxID=196821 RepID=UPI0008CD0B80|nr:MULTISPECIES: glutathione S-transferase family protein [unclassified Pseudomonas]SEO07993.1 glutathione S-transferase [Pseudomonas sp. NFACC39-1]SFG85983.1 glutathione S-transferase [Pseudomonas sp. NFACC45]